MHTYELIKSKEERLEILRDFSCNVGSWNKQNSESHYVSFEANVSIDIDPHLPLRCQERFVSDDAFFLAMETFFNNSGIDPVTNEELPSVADLLEGDRVVICDKQHRIGFVFIYTGYDSYTGMDEVLAKTVIPFFGFDKQYFKKGHKVFELTTATNGEHQVNYVDETTLTFK